MKKATQNKINKAIKLLQHYEKLALKLNPNGYFLAFSGGKDSQLLYLLVELSKVKFKAYYSNTTNDPPMNVKFIRDNYKNVIFLNPKENFYKLVSKKGLPTRIMRYCCAILKEQAGAGNVILTGERRSESFKRKNYPFIAHQSTNAKRNKSYEEFTEIKHECVKGKDRIRIRPLLDFTEEEVFEILKNYKVPLNPCYQYQNRVGCIFCPFAKQKEIEGYCEKYPKAKKTLLKNLQIFLDKKDKKFFLTAEEYFEWWLSKKNIKDYKEIKKQLELNF